MNMISCLLVFSLLFVFLLSLNPLFVTVGIFQSGHVEVVVVLPTNKRFSGIHKSFFGNVFGYINTKDTESKETFLSIKVDHSKRNFLKEMVKNTTSKRLNFYFR